MKILCGFLLAATLCAQRPALDFLNHNRPVLDAHNCYPYDGRFPDRLQRALSSGFPVSIEQDLAWYVDPRTHEGRIVVSHRREPEGSEPTLRQYFFDQVQTTVEQALRENDRARWPLIILHFDFKSTRRRCCTPSGICSANIRTGSPPRRRLRIRTSWRRSTASRSWW